MKKLLFLLLCACALPALAQSGQPPFTPADERMAGYEKRKQLASDHLLSAIEFRNVGPTVFSGRVVDLDVSPDDPSHFYVAYASGGLWKTVNNGRTFEPLFDNEMVITVGDIAVDWDRNTIWLGSGEVNSSRSSYAGAGMYRSNDGGKTWQHLGLEESHHIGRVILDPNDPNTVLVAVLGHLYSPNPERGVYKTTDGGKTWRQVLFVNDDAGAVDLIRDPGNPRVLYAATWHRERRAWNFVEAGQGSAIYRSNDNGETWQRLTTDGSGFPTGEGVGRIGLDAVRQNGRTILYAALDNYDRRPKEPEEEDQLTKDRLRSISREDFLKLDKYLITDYLRSNGFPREYSADKVIGMIRKEEIKPQALVEYVEDANSLLFDTPVIGLEVYRSDDGGKSWKKTHDKYLDAVYNSYGYYFGQIRVAPNDPDKLYIMGVPVLRSDDGGKSWKSIDGENVHSDHHALWANPNRPGHLILGNDGGVNISYDDGETWFKCNSPAVGQFYYIAVDMAKPYNIYGGLQDNGVWFGPSNYEYSDRWEGTGRYPYRSILGGDGMQVAVDTRDNETVYTGFQFGNYFRINTHTGDRQRITPRPKLGERPLRWNWQAPIHLSVHNQDILYMGSNKVHRSLNRGEDFTEISGDLTTGGRKGDVAFSTLSAIHESPLRFGLLYAGSDDGLVHISRDGGYSWQRITNGLPRDMWVSRIQASSFDEATVYLSLNGYRWDDFTPYLYLSNDYGQNWRRIGLDLPLEPINVVKEDPQNRDILYVGTDHGVYVSLDRGQSFKALTNGLPAVPVHDLVIHPREHDLIVGTHGRSIYVGSVRELQQLTSEVLTQPLAVFKVDPIRHSSRWGNAFASWAETRTPELRIPLYASTAGQATFTIRGDDDLVLHRFEADCKPGLNYQLYDLSYDENTLNEYQKSLNKNLKKDEKPIRLKKADNGKLYLQPGKYKIIVEKGGEKQETTLEVK